MMWGHRLGDVENTGGRDADARSSKRFDRDSDALGTERRCDLRVLVVGAGPTGAALSLLLARSGVEVLLVEREEDFGRVFRGEALMPNGVDAIALAFCSSGMQHTLCHLCAHKGSTLALRDAIVAANHLIPALASGDADTFQHAAETIQKEREPEVIESQRLPGKYDATAAASPVRVPACDIAPGASKGRFAETRIPQSGDPVAPRSGPGRTRGLNSVSG